ncbi:MAG: hypothetical protein HYX61_07225 [Gammaproteobacteria bacterium]|jgi:hypothetical protein|nr:hypothetical protein [Gammaproteobacteria bacterium]
MSFDNKKILLATKHNKEKVIKPILEQSLGCQVIVPNDFDTDQFGTFTGEIARILSPKEMVIKKARHAIEQYAFNYAIASEGSFGPHPLIPFAPFNQELLSFIDKENDIEIIVYEHTTETNFATYDLKPTDSYHDFLQQVKFPEHGVIIRALKCNKIIAKGIHEINELRAAMNYAFELSPEMIRIETDMRAMHNPTRMKIIERLSRNLLKRLLSNCAQCGCYGFGELSYHGKLPCELCGGSTEIYQYINEKCIQCDYSLNLPRPDNLTHADSTYCEYCNP